MKKTFELLWGAFLMLFEAIVKIILTVIYLFFYSVEQLSCLIASKIQKKL